MIVFRRSRRCAAFGILAATISLGACGGTSTPGPLPTAAGGAGVTPLNGTASSLSAVDPRAYAHATIDLVSQSLATRE